MTKNPAIPARARAHTHIQFKCGVGPMHMCAHPFLPPPPPPPVTRTHLPTVCKVVDRAVHKADAGAQAERMNKGRNVVGHRDHAVVGACMRGWAIM